MNGMSRTEILGKKLADHAGAVIAHILASPDERLDLIPCASQLFGRKDVDLDIAFGHRIDVFGENLQRLVMGVGRRHGMAKLQSHGRCERRASNGHGRGKTDGTQ